MAEGQVYNIPACRFEWFKERMESLGRKAKKLNGEKLTMMAIGFHNEEDASSRWYGQKIMEVFVACPEPKIAGWEFVARIDHANEAGNLIRSTGLRDLPAGYREAAPTCDHCGHKRKRRDTFVVYNTSEDHFVQVGSSCLKDFIGHGDVDRIAKLAELLASIRGYARGSVEEEFTLYDRRYISTEGFLEQAAEDILRYGFVSKKKAGETGLRPTAESAFYHYNQHSNVSQQAKDLASAALLWAQNLDESEEELNDYLYNCWVVANASGLEERSLGIATSIVGVYYRNQQPKPTTSFHMGTVGEKLEVLVMIDEVRDLEASYMHTLRDRNGNIYKWFASKPVLRTSLGKPVRIRGTVKKHDSFRGINQTILTRVKTI